LSNTLQNSNKMEEGDRQLSLSSNMRPEDEEVENQEFEFFARSRKLMTDLKKMSSTSVAATSSTLVGSCNTGSRSTVNCDTMENTCAWSDMVHRRANMWDDDGDFTCDDDGAALTSSSCGAMQRVLHCVSYEFRHVLRTLRDHPYIPILVNLTFIILSVVAVLVVNGICDHVATENKLAAISEARQTGKLFADQLSNAMLPLHSLRQAVTYSDHFKNLTFQIGEYGALGSAPITHGPQRVDVFDYRDVSGICDDVYVVEKFHEIVTSIQNDFEQDGIDVNYRLAPNNVVCLAEPLVNYEDFSPGKAFNSTDIIGWDLLHTPDSKGLHTLINTYSPSGNPIYTRGPIDFSQGDLNIAELFYAHLAVNMPGYSMEMDGTLYNSWGFVMSIIDWSKLKERSRVFDRIKQQNLDFYLHKIDTQFEAPRMVTIARSDNWYELREDNSVEVSVSTLDGQWINRVGSREGFTPCWRIPGIVASILLAFVLSLMFMMILIERQLHKQLLFNVMPQSALRKLHRGKTVIERFDLVTVFFSDIVDFTSDTGEMKPIQVMEMLNELYTSFDDIAEKYGVYKVETIGGSYMIVGGAPNRIPASEAAEKVALFALEAIEFAKKFKTSMGGQISIRVGIASGPAVAGVVGKSMPRYCFFGDTVNCASRMESTSMTMKIQCSDLTFRLLYHSPNCVFSLEDRTENGTCGIDSKGNGVMNTWWVNSVTEITPVDADVECGKDLSIRRVSHDVSMLGHDEQEFVANISNRSVVTNRQYVNKYHASHDIYTQFKALSGQDWSVLGKDQCPLVAATADRNTMIDRIASMLEIRLSALMQARDQIPLGDVIKKELRAYVAHIESLYNDVEYHRFEHASHVAISMNKLLDFEKKSTPQDRRKIDREMSQDPFVAFMLVYSALVHDVGHTGKSNKILEDQNEELFRNSPTPVAEQLSIRLAVVALERNEFSSLKAAIIPTIEAKFEFTKVLFCAILCTDVASPDRLKLVRERFEAVMPSNDNGSLDNTKCDDLAWHKFSERLCPLLPYRKDICRALSMSYEDFNKYLHMFVRTENRLQQYVCIESLMQVADVAHCMQGWENFIKWNYRLYKEFMDCYKKNLISEPSGTWAAGQIGFINNYILPLAERTEKCCGLAANLNLVELAKQNRLRWENEGQFITDVFINADKNGEDEKSVLEKCFSSKRTC